MLKLDRADLVEVLESVEGGSGDPRVYGDGESRHFMVAAVVDAGRQRHPDVLDFENQMDLFVQASGGERIEVIDPWRAIANLFRRLGGKAVLGRDDMYSLPASAMSRTVADDAS